MKKIILRKNKKNSFDLKICYHFGKMNPDEATATCNILNTGAHFDNQFYYYTVNCAIDFKPVSVERYAKFNRMKYVD